MRKFLFLLILFPAIAFSQSANVQSAADSYKRYKDYAKAKEFIDLAAENPSTANDPKMWYYRGMIYLSLYRDTTGINKSEPDAIEKSAISFLNCLKTDKAKNFTDDCERQVWITGVGLYKKATEALKNNEFERSARLFNRIFEIFPLDKDNNLKRSNITPELVYKGLYYVAAKAKDNEKAKEYLQKLMDMKFNDPMIYQAMSQIYLDQGDTVKAISYIDLGRSVFEDNLPLINEQIRLYIIARKAHELIEKLTQTIEGGQENDAIYYIRGTLYQSEKQEDKAAEDFKKSIEYKADNVDAYYALGAMYFNQAAQMSREASAIGGKDMAAYDKAKAKAEVKFKEAQPYLEKAMEINRRKTEEDNATYKRTVFSLKQLYARTNQTDKYKQLTETAEQPPK